MTTNDSDNYNQKVIDDIYYQTCKSLREVLAKHKKSISKWSEALRKNRYKTAKEQAQKMQEYNALEKILFDAIKDVVDSSSNDELGLELAIEKSDIVIESSSIAMKYFDKFPKDAFPKSLYGEGISFEEEHAYYMTYS